MSRERFDDGNGVANWYCPYDAEDATDPGDVEPGSFEWGAPGTTAHRSPAFRAAARNWRRLISCKQTQVYCIRNGLVAGIVRMQMITAVESGQVHGRIRRIVGGCILIDDTIAGRCRAADKCINLLPRCFALRGPGSRTLIRRERGAIEFYPLSVSLVDQ